MLASLNWPEAFVLAAFMMFIAMVILIMEVNVYVKDDE